MRRVVAVLFLVVAFRMFLGPLIWTLMTIGVATGLGTGEVSFDGSPPRLVGELSVAVLAFLFYRHFDRSATPADEVPPTPRRAAS